jgi:hypothetical protein
VRARPFYFEIKDMLTQFVAAFDDIVIGRFNKDRVERDKINVRYVYAPKQRVLYDLVNENKTLTLPVVSVNVNNISRDNSRVFNKLDGFFYQANVGDEKVSRHLKSPVPINISLSVSILTRFQTDMDQIISNFVPFCNPYVIISWKVPEQFSLSVDQEIRSEVLWNGDVNMNYPTDINSGQKARVTADTSFTIKGWLFKDVDDPQGNIFFVDQNFYNETKLQYYDNFETLSGNTYSFPTSTNLENRVESFELSGSPFITDIFYSGVLLQKNVTISSGASANIILNGEGFTNTETVLFSTNNTSVYKNLTSISTFDRQGPISGESIPFTILNDNTIILNSPPISAGDLRFIPLNKAGYDFSDHSYMDTLSGRIPSLSSVFIKVNAPKNRIEYISTYDEAPTTYGDTFSISAQYVDGNADTNHGTAFRFFGSDRNGDLFESKGTNRTLNFKIGDVIKIKNIGTRVEGQPSLSLGLSGHPFMVKISPTLGNQDQANGVTNNGGDLGDIITFNPLTLGNFYYIDNTGNQLDNGLITISNY